VRGSESNRAVVAYFVRVSGHSLAESEEILQTVDNLTEVLPSYQRITQSLCWFFDSASLREAT
jgi:hypothetical protein